MCCWAEKTKTKRTLRAGPLFPAHSPIDTRIQSIAMKLALICLLALAVIAGVVADKNTASVTQTQQTVTSEQRPNESSRLTHPGCPIFSRAQRIASATHEVIRWRLMEEGCALVVRAAILSTAARQGGRTASQPAARSVSLFLRRSSAQCCDPVSRCRAIRFAVPLEHDATINDATLS